MSCLNPRIDYEQDIYLQGTYDLDLCATPNAPKSHVMQKILGENAHKVQYME